MNGQYLMRLLNQFMKKTIRGFLPRTRRKAGGIRRLTLKYFKIFAEKYIRWRKNTVILS